MYANLPNILSLSRIPGSLLLLIAYDPGSAWHSTLATAILLLIILSDIADGWLARKFNLANQTGYVLDGLGDRAFHIAMYLILYLNQTISVYITWVLLFREISIYSSRLLNQNWLSNQSKFFRFSTKSFAGIVRVIFIVDFFAGTTNRNMFTNYSNFVSCILVVIVSVSMVSIFLSLTKAIRCSHD